MTFILLFLYFRSLFNIQIVTIAIFTGLVIVIFTSEKKPNYSYERTKLSANELILIILLLIMIAFIVTNAVDFDIFIILILIELITFKDFVNKYLNPDLQIRLNIFIYIILVLFVIIIVKKIINLSIMYLD